MKKILLKTPVLHKLKLAKYITQAHYLFALVALFFGLIFCIIVPPFTGIDEAHHFARTYQLSRGNMSAVQQDLKGGGYISSSISETLDDSRNIRKKKTDMSYRALLKKVYTTPITSDKVFTTFPGAAAYNIFAYAPAVAGLLAGELLNLSIGGSLIASRFSMLLAYVAIIAYALYISRSYKYKWMLFVIALLPSSLFLASTVNADSLAIAFSILIFSITLKTLLSKKISKAEVSILFASALILPLVKFNYILISAAILLIPSSLLIKSNVSKKIDKKHFDIAKALIISTAFILSFLWVSSASWSVDTIRAAGIGPDQGTVDDQVNYLLANPLSTFKIAYNTLFLNGANMHGDYIMNMLGGRLGFNNATLPAFTTILSGLLLLMTAAYSRTEFLRVRKELIAMVVFCTLIAASVFGSLYLSFSPVGSNEILGVQGRYFLPLLPFILAASSIYIPVKLLINKKNYIKLVAGTIILNLTIAAYYYFVISYFGRVAIG
jgi:uncharacterized membrane protein